MVRRLLLLAAVATTLLAPAAEAARYVPDEVVVRYGPASSPTARVVHVAAGSTVAETAARLRRRPGVLSATPNFIARASFIPNDPGRVNQPGGWQLDQWNFAGPFGVNAPAAWDNLARVGRPGGKGVVVAGLAFGAKIMPVRVLDRRGEGDSAAISRGIRFAASKGARVINLSFEFGKTVRARQIPDILDALRFARRKGVLVVGASGNEEAETVAYPARANEVLAVGATTESGCLAAYSNHGPSLDLVAPGGGRDALIDGDPNCRPELPRGGDIVQMTFTSNVRSFSLPNSYRGTSMAAPHVAATAALVIASGVLGSRPSPDAIETHLKETARDLGAPGRDSVYGAGLVDAAAATAPTR